MERYEIQSEIGEGSFGVVQMARHKETGDTVAIKRIKKRYRTWDECMNLREIRSLSKLKHQNIVRLREVFREDQELFLVFEYCGRNLLQYLSEDFTDRGRRMPESEIRSLLKQALSGLAYTHKAGFFHRDLKPENLLVGSKGILKLADFGLAREIRSAPPFTDYVATRWYRAPEILLKSPKYSSPADIFALGCIAAELFLGKPLFPGISELDQLSRIFAVLGSPDRSWTDGFRLAGALGFSFPSGSGQGLSSVLKTASAEAVDLISQMLAYDAARRPSAAKLLTHAFFRPPELDSLLEALAASSSSRPTPTTRRLPTERPGWSCPKDRNGFESLPGTQDLDEKPAAPVLPGPSRKARDALFDDQLEELLRDPKLCSVDRKREYRPRVPDPPRDSLCLNPAAYRVPSYLTGIQPLSWLSQPNLLKF